jgi:hypothetical protein
MSALSDGSSFEFVLNLAHAVGGCRTGSVARCKDETYEQNMPVKIRQRNAFSCLIDETEVWGRLDVRQPGWPGPGIGCCR